MVPSRLLPKQRDGRLGLKVRADLGFEPTFEHPCIFNVTYSFCKGNNLYAEPSESND